MLWVLALLPLVLFCVGFAYLLVLLDRSGGKSINFSTSKTRELSERNSPTVPPTVIINDDEEELAWAIPPVPGQPVCGNMGPDGKWTFEKLNNPDDKK